MTIMHTTWRFIRLSTSALFFWVALGTAGNHAAAQTSTIVIQAIEVRDTRNDELLLSKLVNGTTGATTTTGLTAAGKEFFNNAHCSCGSTVEIRVRLTPNPSDTTSNKLFLVAGAGTCINTTNSSIDSSCTKLHDALFSEIREDIVITAPTDQLMGDCTKREERNIYVFTGQESSIQPSASAAYSVDGTPPTAPVKDGDPLAGEGMVELRFRPGDTNETELNYQILCMVEATGRPGLDAPPQAAYSAKSTICPDATGDAGLSTEGGTLADAGAGQKDAAAAAADAASADAGPSDGALAADAGPTADAAADAGPTADAAAALDTAGSAQDTSAQQDTAASTANATGAAAIAQLDPAYVCSEASPSGPLAARGLKDDTSYRFYVIAIDRQGNPSSPVELGVAKPVLAEDIWERYKRQGGSAEEGFCTIGGSGGWTAALALLLLALLRRRRGGGVQ